MKKVFFLIALVFVIAPMLLLAAENPADINKDGFVQPIEKRAFNYYKIWRAEHNGMYPEQPLDINGDGMIGPGERRAYIHFSKTFRKMKKIPPGQARRAERMSPRAKKIPPGQRKKRRHYQTSPYNTGQKPYIRRWAQNFTTRSRPKKYGGYFSLSISGMYGLNSDTSEVGAIV